MSEPESPELRNALRLLLTIIWPVKVFVNAAPPAHSFSYATLMVALRLLMLLRDNAVVRPLFLTAFPMEALAVCDESVPISRIAPSDRTMPGITIATLTSTFEFGSALNFWSVPTFWALVATQPTSINPG